MPDAGLGVSSASRFVLGLGLILIPTVAYGGFSVLQMLLGRIPGYHENPLRKAFFRAGHAHAGVLLLLALVGITLSDSANLSEGLRALVRWCLFATPLLVSAGFFLSVLPPKAERPGPLIALLYTGILTLSVGTLTLGIGLLRSLQGG